MTATPERSLALNQPTGSIALQLAGDAARLAVLKDVIAKGCTDEELETFALVCQRTRLDPFARQIYAIKRWDSRANREVLTIVTGVDGFRLNAQRSHQYAGQVGPQWCGEDGVWKDVWLDREPPAAARVGVLRKGFAQPIWSVATWARSAQYIKSGNTTRLGPFWERQGAEMLAKTAEVNALKRAFPQETSDIEYAPEEVEAEREDMLHNAAEYDRIIGSNYEEHRPIRNTRGDTVDGITGEVLEDAPAPAKVEDPRVTKRAQLSELLAEARKRDLKGEPPLGHSADEDPLDVAIAYWFQRIENHDLDAQAERQSKQAAF